MIKKLVFDGSLNESIKGVCLTSENDKLIIKLSYSYAFGMGEKFDSLNQKGKVVTCKVEEKFCFQGEKTYCPSPFFFTDTNFGLYVDSFEVTTFDFQDSKIVVSLPKGTSLYCFWGSYKTIIRSFLSIFDKKPILPPSWVFGPWVSANRWNKQEDVDNLIDNLKKYDFPASVVVLEAWSDEATFYVFNGAKHPVKEKLDYSDFDFSSSPWPNPKAMIDKLHENGLKLLLWQVPVYKKQGDDEILNEQNEADRKEAIEKSYCVLNADNSPYTIEEGHWFSGSMVPDFTNVDTVKSWFSKRQYLLDMGVDGFKTDGGEFIYSTDIKFSNNSNPKEGVNRYCQDYEKAYLDFAKENRVIFSRAGFAPQALTPIHWAGDQQSQNSELKSVLKAALSAACSGLIFWGFDLAGFAGPLPTLDLYNRATQMSTFVPIMQWHSEPDGGQFKDLMRGAEGNNERSPWNMATSYNYPKFVNKMRFWHKLRESLTAFLTKVASDCTRSCTPMLSPLFLFFEDDKHCLSIDDQFMLSEALLVAPLLEENQSKRSVYLPKGSWKQVFTNKIYQGPLTIEDGTKDRLPVFINLNADESLLKLLPTSWD